MSQQPAAVQLKILLSHDYYKNGESPIPASVTELLVKLCEQIEDQNKDILALQQTCEKFATMRDLERSAEEFRFIKSQIEDKIIGVGASFREDADDRTAKTNSKFTEMERRFAEYDARIDSMLNDDVHSVKLMCTNADLGIRELKDKINVINGSQKHQREMMDQLRAAIPPNPETKFGQINRRLDRVDATFRKIENDISKKDSRTKELIEELKDTDATMRVELHNTILEIEAKAKAMPSTYATEDDQPKIVDGGVDISPLIKGIYRDSKRLDGFNELIATTRLECQDLVNAILDMQANMQKFNHNTHDLAMEDARMKGMFSERMMFMQSSIMDLDKQITDVLAFMYHMSESCSHLAANISTGFDQMQAVVQSLTTRPLPMMIDLEETKVEVNTLKENIFEKRTQFEGDREKYRVMPSDDGRVNVIRDIRVKKLERRTYDQQKDIVLPYNEIQNRIPAHKSDNSDSLLQRSVEELRVRLNETTSDMEVLQTHFKELTKDVSKQLEVKVDEQSMERMLDKVHRLINQLTKRIDTMDDQQKVQLQQPSDEQATMKRSVEPSTKKRIPSIPRDQVQVRTSVKFDLGKPAHTSLAYDRTQSEGILGRALGSGRSNRTISELQKSLASSRQTSVI